MSIYTREGDNGRTSLASGRRVPKYDDCIEAYGTIDELQASIGLARSFCDDSVVRDILFQIENKLMPIMGELSMETAIKNTSIDSKDISYLESLIDEYGDKLPPFAKFEIPGENSCNAALHLARTICRRAERKLHILSARDSVSPNLLAWINRLSDLLFTLSRFVVAPIPSPDEDK